MRSSKTCRSTGASLCLWLGSALTLVSCALLPVHGAAAAQQPHEPGDFATLSLEEFGLIHVTSVSKKSERLNQVPAAVSAITGDELRRSRASTLPLAPGVQVGRAESAQSAVNVRGFNETYSQKLLVLVDGRSIYSPLISGTIWQARDAMLEELNRIEAICGPGGNVWGANAVNGVINIVSKPARETQGNLLSVGGGSEQLGLAGFRYGGPPGEESFFRLYGEYDDWNNSRPASRAVRNLELALVGRNLAASHRELNPSFASTSFTEVSRGNYGN